MQRFVPVLAQTRVLSKPFKSKSCTCVRYIFVRSGSAIVSSDKGDRSLLPGDLMILGPNLSCEKIPNSTVTLTTVYADFEYLADQLLWEMSTIFIDRSQVLSYLGKTFPEQEVLLRLNAEDHKRLSEQLNLLVSVSKMSQNFYQIQSAFGEVLQILNQRLLPVELLQNRGLGTPTVRRTGVNSFKIVSREAAAIRGLIEREPSRRWTLAELAQIVHLSPSQSYRQFVAAYGTSPLGYQTIQRVRFMAHCLRTTRTPVKEIAREAGWRDAGHAAEIFLRHFGQTPTGYRSFFGDQSMTSAELSLLVDTLIPGQPSFR
ncbi:helix-turn-helix domain-containing protein [Leucobacter sp. wl10]|uniref:helix-turn-helix domain-containing protein n=1 Tax=Leucobacter sp. wl10 TaxID=2304677 RepID=UPI0009D9DB3C|nr:AraC family transcriptional regulator [Leucobacter sp. wl10]RGE16501.1 AraC family transcriptional regulator [Leucobacter sp. wl10]